MIDLITLDGIGPQLARRIQQHWPKPHRLEEMLHQNPYDLTRVSGIGFTLADRVALQLGTKPDSRDRRRAATLHAVKEVQKDGHTCIPLDELILEVMEYVGADPDIDQPDLISEGGLVAYAPTYRAERYCAQRLMEMVEFLPWPNPIIAEGLAVDQLQALEQILHQKFFVLLGQAGTGKTFLLKTLLANLNEAGQSYALAAPTGKAAKRIEELTGSSAKTIHRLLEATYDEMRGRFYFRRDERNPLDVDWVIIDEASMIDVQLMQSLLRAIPPHARLLLVGDPFQLPSVGAGDVLRDLTSGHGLIPYVNLELLKRQDPAHLLAANCARVRTGQMVEVANERAADFFFIELGSGPHIVQEVVGLVADRLPAKWGISTDDVQVITARRESGDIACSALNSALRARLNPGAADFEASGAVANCRFAPGDRVIQTKNDYKLGVMNGEVGRILDISDRKEIKVRFDTIPETVEIPPGKLNLDFAWALTVHKFQGSQAPWVILPIHGTSGTTVPRRRWLYTGISRGVHCVVVGDPREFESTIERSNDLQRCTNLARLLAASQGGNTRA
jgi:exodeoxyribonuclease V alpha subunit